MIEPPWLDRSAYPFAHNAMDLSAGRIHYVDEGTGPPILLVHGTPTWSFEFRHLIRSLAPRWRTIAPDHLGFGLSSRPPSFPYTPEAHASILREFVERLGLSRFALVVHDFGGPIGLPLCLDPRFEITHLVLLNTWMWPINAGCADEHARVAPKSMDDLVQVQKSDTPLNSASLTEREQTLRPRCCDIRCGILSTRSSDSPTTATG